MKTTVYYFERLNDKPLAVETEDLDLALKTLEQYTGKDFHWLLFRVGKGYIIQNSTVKDTYFKKFLDLVKIPITDIELIECYKPCSLCGK